MNDNTEKKIKNQILADEGYTNKVYLDSEGNLTVGIGHLVLSRDVLKLNDEISDAEVLEFFDHDFSHAIEGCCGIINNFDSYPDDVQGVLINMCFNMGPYRLREFKKMLAAIKIHDYKTAAKEMLKSKWRNQVGDRAERLAKIMEDARD